MSEPMWRRVLRLHGPDPRADVHDEFAFHIAERTEALVAAGLSESDAREQALAQFGDFKGAAATCTDIGSRRIRRARWREVVASLWQDIGYAGKAMRRAKGFTFTAVTIIALGIGANTTVFSLLNALLLQPLDAANPGELVRVYTSQGRTTQNERDLMGASSYADYIDLRQSKALAGLAASMPMSASIRLNDALSRFEARIVSENYFALLGRPLQRGGWRSDGHLVGTPEIIISHRFWANTLHGDSDVLGRTLFVNGRSVVIAGVTSPEFRGVEPSNVDVYFAFQSAAELTARSDILSDRGERSVRLLGRLAHGAPVQLAEQSLNGIMTALGQEFPGSNAKRVISVRAATSIVPLELTGKGLLPTAGLIFGATLVMLAITGVNIAAVLLARTIRRRRELAVRLSLGASPFRLVRQLVTESIMLALLAGVVVVVLVSLLPMAANALGVPPSVQPNVNLTVLAYAVSIAVAFGAVFGLAPALFGIRSDVVASLRSGEGDTRPSKARAQRVLVSAQLALSMVLLLVGGGLLASLERQQRVNPGFVAERLVIANFEDPSGTFNGARERAFTQLAVERLSAIPGVTSVSVASMAPLTSDGMRSTIHIAGYAPQADERMDVQMVVAGPEFFKTLRIPLQSGRELHWTEHDTLARVVVNQSMARRYWGGRNPVGSFVQLGGRGGTSAEVIGVSADARFLSLSEAPQPMFVVQRAAGGGETVLIRTSGDVSALALAVRGTMARNDVPFTLAQLRTMDDVVQNSLLVTRAVTSILMTIGLLAILLAAVGLHGVVSYVMAGRAREFGVRLALGASSQSITRLVLGYGMRLTAIGGAVGMIIGLATLRLIGGMLFGSWISVPITAVVTFVLCGASLVACAIPAVRATAISPASAMRSE